MLAIFLTILITFLISSLFGYVVHKSLHQEWTGSVHQAHMTHHLRLYPPDDYVSDVYRDAGKDSTPKFFAIAAVPLVSAPIILWLVGALSLSLMVVALIVEVIMAFLHNYLHDAFHIRNHWLYRIPGIGSWFQHLVDLHWMHHIDMNTNYGIFYFIFDRLFRTFQETK